MMECWNAGVLESWTKNGDVTIHYSITPLLHYSSTPLLHYSITPKMNHSIKITVEP
jgi:hypothetical protein